jgi:cytochrome c
MGIDMRLILFVLTIGIFVLCGCKEKEKEKEQAAALTGGFPGRGREAIRRYGCGSCHTIPGVVGADAVVGPSLEKMALRGYVAGVRKNTPENLIEWLKGPPHIDAQTAMPDLKITDQDARDIAAYLYTLR